MTKHSSALSRASLFTLSLLVSLYVGMPGTSAADTPSSTSSTAVHAPIVCTNGPSGQVFDAHLTMPSTARVGSTYSVRIDGVPSGTISHVGLNFIHDMTTVYGLPTGVVLVTGSLKIVPDTGSSNVAPTARATEKDGKVIMVLPGRVDSGSSYTPPSIEFRLEVTAKPGSFLPLTFLEYRVTANAFLVGNVHTSCVPDPNPFVMGRTTVTSAAPT
jgi:hypothetical protein